jgi:hypothetical protein
MTYPNVWRLAQRILAIPDTSAPSERVVSAADHVVNKKRVRLELDNVNLLKLLRGNKNFVEWEDDA